MTGLIREVEAQPQTLPSRLSPGSQLRAGAAGCPVSVQGGREPSLDGSRPIQSRRVVLGDVGTPADCRDDRASIRGFSPQPASPSTTRESNEPRGSDQEATRGSSTKGV